MFPRVSSKAVIITYPGAPTSACSWAGCWAAVADPRRDNSSNGLMTGYCGVRQAPDSSMATYPSPLVVWH